MLKKELVAHLYAVKKEGARVATAESMVCAWVKRIAGDFAAKNPGADNIFTRLHRQDVAEGRIQAD